MDRRTALAAAAAVVLAPAVAARTDPWAALQAGGVAILLRHAQTEPGVGDPPGFRIGDCSTQRNLSDDGRRQARRIGEALAARRVRIDHVLSSQWCRCLETARLAFPGRPVEPWPALNSFFDDRSTEPRQTREAATRLSRTAAASNAVCPAVSTATAASVLTPTSDAPGR